VSKKRDAAYYRKRLKRDHAVIFRALADGRLPSVRQAAAAAGLIHLPTPLDVLKREWKKATASEQAAFDSWRAGLPKAGGPPTIADATGKLTPEGAKFLSDWMRPRKIRAGQIMLELGLSNYDWRLDAAIQRGYPLKDEVLKLLGPWMRKNGF
jgi:hypothetical protein